jgi:hypothetical protein
MHKLIPVEEAKALMSEAKDWSVWTWLTGKRKLRLTADAAWEALDECEEKVRHSWSDDLQKAWQGKHVRVDPEIKLVVEKLKKADAEAYDLRMKAEATFDEADRRMSTSMASEGAQQAIDAWDLREKFVRKLEQACRRK